MFECLSSRGCFKMLLSVNCQMTGRECQCNSNNKGTFKSCFESKNRIAYHSKQMLTLSIKNCRLIDETVSQLVAISRHAITVYMYICTHHSFTQFCLLFVVVVVIVTHIAKLKKVRTHLSEIWHSLYLNLRFRRRNNYTTLHS